MRRTARLTWVAASVTVMLLAGAVDADARVRRRDLEDPRRDYTQRGLQIYGGIGGQSYHIDEDEFEHLEDLDDNRLGFIGTALGLDRGLALYLELAGSKHDTPIGGVVFGSVHIGMKYAFATGYRHLWQPYGKASIGGIFLWEDDEHHLCRGFDDDDNGYVGPSVGFAAGLDRFIGRRTALFFEVGMVTGEFDHIIIDGKEYDLADNIAVTAGRFLFGLRVRL
jgi:hypothetical protein